MEVFGGNACQPVKSYYSRRCLQFLVEFATCLFVCQQLCAKTSEQICMKFSGMDGNGPLNKRLNFGGEPNHESTHQDCHTGKT